MKRIVLTENQLRNIFLTENRASKNQSLARKMVRELSPNTNDKEFTENVLHDIPNVRKADFHLYPAVVRFVLENNNTLDNITIQNLNKYIGVIAPKAKELGLDQNANGMTLQAFFEKYKTEIDDYISNSKKLSAQYDTNKNNGKNNGYNIVPIPTFEKAAEYGRYTDWCITQSKDAFYDYTNHSMGLFYFLLKDGFENVPQKKGSNCPLDDYGLSMIAVSFLIDGSVNTVTCRWNHSNGGNDSIMTPEQVSKLIGQDIYSIFNSKDIEGRLPDSMTLVKYFNKFDIYLCKDETKGFILIEGDFSYWTPFGELSYKFFRGEDKQGEDYEIVITNTGKILEYSLGYSKGRNIYCIQRNNMLFIANRSENGTKGGIYDLNTFEKIPQSNFNIQHVEELWKFILMSNSEGQQFVYNGSKKNGKYLEQIYDKIITEKNKIFIIDLENNVTGFDSFNGRIILDKSKLISNVNNHNTFFCYEEYEKKIYAVSKKYGVLNSDSIHTIYQICNTEYKYLIGKFIAETYNEIVLFDKNGEFINYINDDDFIELKQDNELKEMEPIQAIKLMM